MRDRSAEQHDAGPPAVDDALRGGACPGKALERAGQVFVTRIVLEPIAGEGLPGRRIIRVGDSQESSELWTPAITEVGSNGVLWPSELDHWGTPAIRRHRRRRQHSAVAVTQILNRLVQVNVQRSEFSSSRASKSWRRARVPPASRTRSGPQPVGCLTPHARRLSRPRFRAETRGWSIG